MCFNRPIEEAWSHQKWQGILKAVRGLICQVWYNLDLIIPWRNIKIWNEEFHDVIVDRKWREKKINHQNNKDDKQFLT